MSIQNHNHIWELIKSLLHNHDCVIVPGFGGFVCNRESARIDQVSHVILPPGKRIVFNQNLKSNDGLLAGNLAEKLAIPYIQAVNEIELLVNALLSTLQDKKQCSIDSFGSFRLNAEANFVFLPDKQNNFLFASYGLQPIQAEYISTGYARIKRTRIFKNKKGNKVIGGRVKNLGPKILVTTLLLMLVANSWIFFREHSIKDLQIGTAGMEISTWFDSVFNKQEQTSIQEPLQVVKEEIITITDTSIKIDPETGLPILLPELSELTTQADSLQNKTDTLVSVVEDPNATYVFELEKFGKTLAVCKQKWHVDGLLVSDTTSPIVETENVLLDKPEPVAEVTGVNAFYIIGGVFCKQRNALQFQDKLIEKGYHSEILINPELNCRRVSYASYASRGQAEQKLKEIQDSENADAWILAPDSK